MTSCRVLFLYPNERDMSLVPPVFGLFAALLKERGHTTSLFDCTGYNFEGKVDADVALNNALVHKPTDETTHKGVTGTFKGINKSTNMYDDFIEKVESFSPDLIAMSVTESTFLRGITVLDHLRQNKKHNILTAIGGVFPTFAPERASREPSVDIVCVGEGDVALVDLCENLARSKDFSQIPNLWVKKSDGTTVKNPPGPAVDINLLPPIDFSIFDDDRFYRPMRGKIFRMLPVETHRGCPYTCTFCNSPSQNTLYDEQTQSKFFRKKSVEKIREEIINFKNQANGEYVFFWADTFLAWSMKELAEFCEMYSEFKFPFWCQSRAETVSDSVDGYKKLKMLKEAGMDAISFGMEHGNEKFRRDVVGRDYTNEDAIEALKNPAKLDIPFTLGNIIGFPDETYELSMDTIEINRQINPFNLSCAVFAPFQGTALRTLAEKRGYIEPDLVSPHNGHISSLTMPGFSKDAIVGLQRCFVMYVRFPKTRWSEIKKAEALTPEGDAIWESLREEFLDTYWEKATLSPEPVFDKVNN